MTSECSVTMAFFWQGALLWSLAVAVSVYAGNIAAIYHLNLNACELKLEGFVSRPLQT